MGRKGSEVILCRLRYHYVARLFILCENVIALLWYLENGDGLELCFPCVHVLQWKRKVI